MAILILFTTYILCKTNVKQGVIAKGVELYYGFINKTIVILDAYITKE
jgi:hypothetical protein